MLMRLERQYFFPFFFACHPGAEPCSRFNIRLQVT